MNIDIEEIKRVIKKSSLLYKEKFLDKIFFSTRTTTSRNRNTKNEITSITGDGRMKNMKFDIMEMAGQFNAALNKTNSFNVYCKDITREQMSEMVQKHAFKLGYLWHNKDTEVGCLSWGYLFIDSSISCHDSRTTFEEREYKKTGLEFFSIKPLPKYVNVRMPEHDYLSMAKYAEEKACHMANKWELVGSINGTT